MQCESLTFRQAVERALNRNGNVSSPQGGQTAGEHHSEIAGLAANERRCPVHLQDYAGIAARLSSANELGLLQAGPILAEFPGNAGNLDLQSRKNVILCTALLYSELEGIQARELVLHQQQEYVNRLMDIESRRVSAKVDQPLLLTHAKLLRARTRMESAALRTFEHKTRVALSALVGLPSDQVAAVENSMPPLPGKLATTVENDETLQQLTAYRDIVQLDYVSESMARLKISHDMLLAKASVGSLVAAHITEEIKFGALLQLNNHIRTAKIQFLSASDDLESWALRRPTPNANRSLAPPIPPETGLSSQAADLTSSVQSPSLLSILISPAIKELQSGKSQQYSAVATYSDGHARDVTSEANWSCSSDTNAVLSATGLLTGLSVGVVTVSVEFQGLTQSRRLSITEQPIDE
jgi:hypothetical protein